MTGQTRNVRGVEFTNFAVEGVVHGMPGSADDVEHVDTQRFSDKGVLLWRDVPVVQVSRWVHNDR